MKRMSRRAKRAFCSALAHGVGVNESADMPTVVCITMVWMGRDRTRPEGRAGRGRIWQRPLRTSHTEICEQLLLLHLPGAVLLLRTYERWASVSTRIHFSGAPYVSAELYDASGMGLKLFKMGGVDEDLADDVSYLVIEDPGNREALVIEGSLEEIRKFAEVILAQVALRDPVGHGGS